MMDAKAYWEPYQAFKMERFAKTVIPNLGGGGGGVILPPQLVLS